MHSTMYFFPCREKTGIKIVDGKRRKLRRVMWEHHVVFFIKILVKYVRDDILRYFLLYYYCCTRIILIVLLCKFYNGCNMKIIPFLKYIIQIENKCNLICFFSIANVGSENVVILSWWHTRDVQDPLIRIICCFLMLHNSANRNNKNVTSVGACDNARVPNFAMISYRDVLAASH